MKTITKKRFAAFFIDSCISTIVSVGIESLLRKRIKNEAFHLVVLPIVSQYTLEYVQMRQTGKTIGYQLMGLELQNEAGSKLSTNQILKRMIHRDTTSTMAYLTNRSNFEEMEGSVLPHDAKTGTIVKTTKE